MANLSTVIEQAFEDRASLSPTSAGAEVREAVAETIAQLDIPQGMSVIARTAGIGRSVEELQWDMSYLLQLWRAIETAANQQSGAFLIYQDASLVIRAIRDYFHQDIGEILIDTESIYEQAHQFMGHVMPQNVNRVKLYKGEGCDQCGGTGYKGRQGLYEVMLISSNIRSLIMAEAGTDELVEQALKEGMLTLRMDGLKKLERGITTLEEVLKETASAT